MTPSVPRTSRGRKAASAPAIAVGPRIGKRHKSTNAKKKPFQHVANLSVSVYAGRSRTKNTRTQQLVRNTQRVWNKTRSKVSMQILIWTERPTMQRKRCNYPVPCVFTNDHSLYNASDVVILYTRLVAKRHLMPSSRPPQQHWIRYLREAPVRFKLNIKPYETWFNWTITYSMNGDVVVPYGMCLPTRDKVAKDPGSITDVIRRVYGESAESLPWLKRNVPNEYTPYDHAKGKTRLLLWLVGHCTTYGLRERYVAELKRYVDIDILGECVGNPIDKKHTIDLFKTHKFYLAFENSLCTDYITEKAYGPLQKGIVPVVLGGAEYKVFLPPHSYINVKDYSSPKDLAKYLQKLDSNDTLYNEYFAWKQNYTCFGGTPGKSLPCDVCRMMNENRNKINIIPDINKFWGPDSCVPPKEYYKGIASNILGRTVSTETGPKWPSFI